MIDGLAVLGKPLPKDNKSLQEFLKGFKHSLLFDVKQEQFEPA